MSDPSARPARRPLALLLIAIGGWLNALLALVRALTRSDAGPLGWPSVALWLVVGGAWFWQWRRAVRQFDAAPRRRQETSS